MALFGGKDHKETKEEKEARKVQETLNRYDLQALSDPKDIDSVKRIVAELCGTDLMELGVIFGAGNEKDFAKQQMYYQRAMIEQNFIIIRQLDRIAKLLEKNQ